MNRYSGSDGDKRGRCNVLTGQPSWLDQAKHADKEMGRPALKQPSFSRNFSAKFVESLCFEMKFTIILQTKTCELAEEEKIPIIKKTC